MYISLKTLELRYKTYQCVQRLIESGEFPNQKAALEYIIDRTKEKKAPNGFDNCTDPYSAYRQFIKSLRKNNKFT